MKRVLLFFLLTLIAFVSCKKNETVFIPNQGCVTGLDYLSMAHSEYGHVNSTQAYSHNVSVLAVPYHENNEDLRLVCYFGIEYETYVMSVIIKEGISPGTYSLVDGMGRKGKVNVVFFVVKRENLEQLVGGINEHHPQAFYTIENIRQVNEGHQFNSPIDSQQGARRWQLKRR